MLAQMMAEVAKKAASEAVQSVVSSMSTNTATPTEAKEEDRFLRGSKAICDFLKISRTTLWKLKKAKKIPFIQYGRIDYYDKREVERVFFRR